MQLLVFQKVSDILRSLISAKFAWWHKIDFCRYDVCCIVIWNLIWNYSLWIKTKLILPGKSKVQKFHVDATFICRVIFRYFIIIWLNDFTTDGWVQWNWNMIIIDVQYPCRDCWSAEFFCLFEPLSLSIWGISEIFLKVLIFFSNFWVDSEIIEFWNFEKYPKRFDSLKCYVFIFGIYQRGHLNRIFKCIILRVSKTPFTCFSFIPDIFAFNPGQDFKINPGINFNPGVYYLDTLHWNRELISRLKFLQHLVSTQTEKCILAVPNTWKKWFEHTRVFRFLERWIFL